MPQSPGVANELCSNQRLAHTVANPNPREAMALLQPKIVSTMSG